MQPRRDRAGCGGVLLEITDAAAARPVAAGLHLAAIVFRLYPTQSQWLLSNEKGFNHFDRLVGNTQVRKELLEGSDTEIGERIRTWTGNTGNWPPRVHAVLQYS